MCHFLVHTKILVNYSEIEKNIPDKYNRIVS